MAAPLSKPYTITDADKQAEDIDRMFDELYRAQAQDALVTGAVTGASKSGVTIAQVSARVLHEL